MIRSVFILFLALLSGLCDSLKGADDSVRGFVSVEPFELRLEAIVKVDAFRNSWRLSGETIGSAQQQAVLENVVTLLKTGVNVRSGESSIDYSSQSVRFVQFDPERGYVPDDRTEIPITDALVGITLSSDARGIRSLDIEWFWFAPEQERLVLEIASRGKPSARYLTPDQNRVAWSLEADVSVPTLLEVPPVVREQSAPLRHLLFVGIALLVVAAIAVLKHQRKAPSWVGWMTLAGIALAVASFRVQIDRVILPGEATREEITYASLRNIYHAFDFRDESAIYDTLEKTVSGPLLERIYLEIRSSLELENTGGPRVRVYEIALREVKEAGEPGEEESRLSVIANWATIGEVTHWGHTHERTNRYEAQLTFTGIEESWKVTGLDLLNEERVQKISRRASTPVALPVEERSVEPDPGTNSNP